MKGGGTTTGEGRINAPHTRIKMASNTLAGSCFPTKGLQSPAAEAERTEHEKGENRFAPTPPCPEAPESSQAQKISEGDKKEKGPSASGSSTAERRHSSEDPESPSGPKKRKQDKGKESTLGFKKTSRKQKGPPWKSRGFCAVEGSMFKTLSMGARGIRPRLGYPTQLENSCDYIKFFGLVEGRVASVHRSASYISSMQETCYNLFIAVDCGVITSVISLLDRDEVPYGDALVAMRYKGQVSLWQYTIRRTPEESDNFCRSLKGSSCPYYFPRPQLVMDATVATKPITAQATGYSVLGEEEVDNIANVGGSAPAAKPQPTPAARRPNHFTRPVPRGDWYLEDIGSLFREGLRPSLPGDQYLTSLRTLFWEEPQQEKIPPPPPPPKALVIELDHEDFGLRATMSKENVGVWKTFRKVGLYNAHSEFTREHLYSAVDAKMLQLESVEDTYDSLQVNISHCREPLPLDEVALAGYLMLQDSIKLQAPRPKPAVVTIKVVEPPQSDQTRDEAKIEKLAVRHTLEVGKPPTQYATSSVVESTSITKATGRLVVDRIDFDRSISSPVVVTTTYSKGGSVEQSVRQQFQPGLYRVGKAHQCEVTQESDGWSVKVSAGSIPFLSLMKRLKNSLNPIKEVEIICPTLLRSDDYEELKAGDTTQLIKRGTFYNTMSTYSDSDRSELAKCSMKRTVDQKIKEFAKTIRDPLEMRESVIVSAEVYAAKSKERTSSKISALARLRLV